MGMGIHMIPKGSNVTPGHMGHRSPGLSSGEGFIRDFQIRHPKISYKKFGPTGPPGDILA